MMLKRSTIHQIYRQCDNALPGHRSTSWSMKQKFLALAAEVAEQDRSDFYGQSDYLQHFEQEIATLLGKEAAVFMPSGTMAQQCALRIHCENQKNFTLAIHPSSHLETAEHAAYTYLHNIKRLPFSAPERLQNRTLSVRDFENLSIRPGAILLELPYRPLGFVLPSWNTLCQISQWARTNQIPIHLDGARLWQCKPFYQREYSQVASLFDSVYVSFYKDLGGFCGAMLAGTEQFTQQARIWQRRHGGNLYSQDFNYVSASLGYRTHLPDVPNWVQQAKKIAQALSAIPQIRIYPDPPHTNAFRLYLEGDPQQLLERHMTLAGKTGDFLFFWLDECTVPGFSVTEIQCFSKAMTLDIHRLVSFTKQLFS